jgi:hypothetical protein
MLLVRDDSVLHSSIKGRSLWQRTISDINVNQQSYDTHFVPFKYGFAVHFGPIFLCPIHFKLRWQIKQGCQNCYMKL